MGSQSVGLGLATLLALASPSRPLTAQTDYYNTDAGRPVAIEDAYPVERHAFELQLAPLRVERSTGGAYDWSVEPELAYGVLPRTQLEVAAPLSFPDGEEGPVERGLKALEVSVLHNLNVETAGLPAFAISAEGILPVGDLAPDDPYLSLGGIATRTLRFARFHLNASWTWGPDSSDQRTEELHRWLAGVAVDRVLPLRSALVIGSVYAEQPLAEAADLEWTAEVGLRYQWSPRLALDAGVGRGLTGSDRTWSVTFGSAYVFAVRSLIPVR